MADLNAAVSQLLESQFADLREQVRDLQEKRCIELEKGLEDLFTQAKQREEESKELRNEVDEQKKALAEGLERTTAIESFKADAADLKERFGQREEESTRIRERVEVMEQELEKVRPRLDESVRTVQSVKDRTDEFALDMKTCHRQCSEMQAALDGLRDDMKKVQEGCDAVTSAQGTLDDMVGRKYEKLWQDVLHAVQELKDSQLDAMRKDMDCRYVDAKKESKGLISYALNLVETVHVERRNKALCKDLVTAWQAQSWHSARRRVGLYMLKNLALRKQRGVVDRWRQQKDVSDIIIRVRKDILPKIPDVELILERVGLERRCDRLDETVQELRVEKCSNQRLDERLQEQSQAVEKRLEVLLEVDKRLAGHDESILATNERGRGYDTRLDGYDQRLTSYEEQVAFSQERLLEFASSKEVQGMMRDVLLIWNSIKSLDAAKADKKDFEGFAVETENRDRHSSRRIEGIEADASQRHREETLRSQERWGEIGQRLDENSAQFRKWEELWDKLSSFVEDLVQKVADLQGVTGDVGRPQLAATSVRSRSQDQRMAGAAGLSIARSRSDIPRTPDVAKAMVDATIDDVLQGARTNGRDRRTAPLSAVIPPRPGRPSSAPRSGTVRCQ